MHILSESIGLYPKMRSKWCYLEYFYEISGIFKPKIAFFSKNCAFVKNTKSWCKSTVFSKIGHKFQQIIFVWSFKNVMYSFLIFWFFCHFFAPKSPKIAFFCHFCFFLQVRASKNCQKNQNLKKLYITFLKVPMRMVYRKLWVILMQNENLHKLFPKFRLKFGQIFYI